MGKDYGEVIHTATWRDPNKGKVEKDRVNYSKETEECSLSKGNRTYWLGHAGDQTYCNFGEYNMCRQIS